MSLIANCSSSAPFKSISVRATPLTSNCPFSLIATPNCSLPLRVIDVTELPSFSNCPFSPIATFNFYVPFIGSAGDYSTRYLTSDNGTVSNGDEIQKVIVIDRTVLSLQASLMDGLVQDLPYDDDGATIMYDKVNDVFKQLKKEKLFSADYVDSETGELVKSYTIKSLSPRGEIKKNYPDYFAQKMFIIEATVALAGSGKRVMITLAY